MVRVYLDLTPKGWQEVEKSDFWIDRPLLNMLNNLKKIQKKNWDGVIIVDGKERSGKSVLGMIMAWYLSDGKIGINNFAKGLHDAAVKMGRLPNGSIMIVDEGGMVFSSKDSQTTEQKNLMKILEVIGQKNMVFIICLPSFFTLNKTIATTRSLWLCHVYADAKYNRGNYALWGESKKKKLYEEGKKNYNSYAKPNASFVGKFMNFNPPFYQDYLEKVKKESLQEVLNVGREGTRSKQQAVMESEARIYGWLIDNKYFKQVDLVNIKKQTKQTVSDRIRLYNQLKEEDALGNKEKSSN